MGLAARARRLRHRAEWVAAALVLLSVPALFLSLYLMNSAAIRPVARPATAGISAPKPPEAAQDPKAEAIQPASGKTSAPGCDDPRVLVDRTHGLPTDYAPTDLVSLREIGVPTLGSNTMLRREAAENLERLVASAAAAGEELVVTSAYRSYEDQRFSYERLVSIYGAEADRMSATPGHSQHQLGTAVDFTNAAVGYEVLQSFGSTTASGWLTRHAHEYGFVLAYPPGEEAETGYEWEPWHYRYVGGDNARRLTGSGLTLQAFLLREGVPPRC
jgi:D-alanyl-D-alanine carboxypeptidase